MAVAAILAVVLLPGVAGAVIYSGSLSTGDGGLVGNGGWTAATLRWDISWSGEATSPWQYSYTLTGPTGPLAKEMSHMLLQVSDTFTLSALNSWGSWLTPSVGVVDAGYESSNPDLPDGFYGQNAVKFDASDTASGYVANAVRFSSWKAPVWGDVYAKDGIYGKGDDKEWTWVYNAGVPDAGFDPSTASLDRQAGAGWAYALRPDTVEGGESFSHTPEPSVGLLLLLGIIPVGIGVRLRRLRRQP